MSGILKKKWTVLSDPDLTLVTKFSSETDIPVQLSKILIRRGITEPASAKTFFVPEINQLLDPFLMKDMDKAVERLLKVIENKENIMVFGDYDVDGTSGVSMFYCFLKYLGITPDVYIPDRFTEGYGLSKKGIDRAAERGLKLIIAIDCGITASEKVEYATSIGVDVIICDHHQPPDRLPNAYAVLDALQTGCQYPFKYLCGTGVAFKLIQAVCIKLGLDLHLSLLDFVAIATSADMVPVTNENRVLVHFGFKQIRDNPRPSYFTLMRNAGIKLENLSTTGVAFGLGPRINAVGRLGDANRAVEFLTCDDLIKVESLASVLESENINRKKIDSEIYLEAQSTYENYKKDFPETDEVAIVLHNSDWHPGVLGIIASRMVEKYYRPSIILTTFKGTAKGSARSISNFNIYEALKMCASECPALLQFGGHFYAAGLEVDLDRVQEFRDIFNRVARNLISSIEGGEGILIPEIKIDSELRLSEINPRFVKILRHFEPYGTGNPNPVFISRNVQVVGEPRVYNSNMNVFKVRDYNPGVPGENVFDCIYYMTSDSGDLTNIQIVRGNIYDMVYSIEENYWNEKTRTQLRLRDLKPAEY